MRGRIGAARRDRPRRRVERPDARSGTRVSLLCTALATLGLPLPAHPQSSSGDGGGRPAVRSASVIDTVMIQRQDLFAEDRAAQNVFLDLLNDLHATTRPFVIRRELLLERGAIYDSARAAESERNLRSLGLFREVRVDTTRHGDRLAAVVRTKDAWSIQPRLEARIASDGTLTGSVGITETNVAGTGNRVRAWYVRQADRDGLVLSARVDRIGHSRVGVGAAWADLSDRSSASWGVGQSFRSFSDRWSVLYGGEAFDGRVLQFRSESPVRRDTTEWTRRALVNRLFVTYAPIATARAYLRIGGTAEVRREEVYPAPSPALEPIQDSLFAVPDTVYGQVGAFVEYRHAEFVRLRHLNGFTDEDLDLSRFVFVGLTLAPGGWGYDETGVGTRVAAGAGARAGGLFLKGRVDASALFDGSAVDSGRVVGIGTAAVKQGPRHATLLRVIGGVQDAPTPGGEFDLGFEVPPRLWGPHAFVGTRTVRGTLEHRFYAWDDLLDLIGLGLAGFVDYGGAWYADQDPRLGGNVGLSLFVGSPLGATAQIAQLSAGYRFGGGLARTEASRWVVSLGSGIVF